jgi:hypothetical protein
MDIDAVGTLGILCGIASFAIKTFIAYKTNQDLDTQINILEAKKGVLKGEPFGTLRNSKPIRDIDDKIIDLIKEYK